MVDVKGILLFHTRTPSIAQFDLGDIATALVHRENGGQDIRP